MDTLQGKTVIVTGASRGIGEATAHYLGELGANIVLAARSGDKLAAVAASIEETGAQALAHPCDMSRFEDVKTVVAAATEAFGQVDILVNNAGVIDPIARLADSDPSAWGHAVDVNLKGVYHGLRAVIPVMREHGGGTIVNISSGAATSALEGWSHYCATKAAVLSLTACAHKEYTGHGIRVAGLSPGTVATDMQTAIRQSGLNPVSRLDPSVHIPADWVARAVAFLCGPGGARYSGKDFPLKTDEGRALVGLPPV